MDMDSSEDAYCLICALCAFIMIQPGIRLHANQNANGYIGSNEDTVMGNQLLEEISRFRRSCDYVESPTNVIIITSFLLFGCFFCLDKHNSAWFQLREATTLAQISGMEDEETYSTGHVADDLERRKLFWLLFVTERYTLKVR